MTKLAPDDPGRIRTERIVDVPEWLGLLWSVAMVLGIGGGLGLLEWLVLSRLLAGPR